jgi:hypothetical protein
MQSKFSFLAYWLKAGASFRSHSTAAAPESGKIAKQTQAGKDAKRTYDRSRMSDLLMERKELVSNSPL